MKRDEERICGTCKYHRHENIDDGWVCVCPDSEEFSDWTDYSHGCEEWEGRQ